MKYFVVNDQHHDFSALSDGQVVFLTTGKLNIFATDRIKNDMKSIMQENNISKDDFLVLSGSNILCVLAALSMKELVGEVNVSLYNFSDKKYCGRTKI